MTDHRSGVTDCGRAVRGNMDDVDLQERDAPGTVALASAPAEGGGRSSGRRTAFLGLAAICCAAGVVLRWWPRPVLWLDEAQSVAFAALPVTEIPGALREDGAPPLYYLLLHWWMQLVGDGDHAVRALSAALSTATLVVLAVLVRKRWGTTVAVVATVLMATNPFAIRYATYTRMYALVMFEVVVGLALVLRALERPRAGRLVAVALMATALLYTHYWALYLLITTAAVLIATSRQPDAARRRARRLVAGAVLAGFVLWLPWIPTFLFQSRHTATPWAPPATAAATLEVFAPTVEGPSLVGVLLGCLVGICFASGLRSRNSGRLITLSAVGVGGAITACLAVMGAIASSSAVSSRYLSVAVPLIVLAAAGGLVRLPSRWRPVMLALLAVVGLWLARDEVVTERTTAGEVAAMILAEARPGDVVVTCPDQLSPALHRLLARSPIALAEQSFPPGSTAARVDWIDYADRAENAEPWPAAHQLVADHLTSTIWLVVSTTYPPTQPACIGLLDALLHSAVTPRLISSDRPDLVEHGALWRFDPGGRTPLTQ